MTTYRDKLCDEYSIEIGSIVGCGLDRLNMQIPQHKIEEAILFYQEQDENFKKMAIGERREAIADYIRERIKPTLSETKRGSVDIIVMGNKFHFTKPPLSGLHVNGQDVIGHDLWFPFSGDWEDLFSAVESVMVCNKLAHNVVSLKELRRCGQSIDYKVTFNYPN